MSLPLVYMHRDELERVVLFSEGFGLVKEEGGNLVEIHVEVL